MLGINDMIEIPDEPMTADELQAFLDGEGLEAYRAKRKSIARISCKSRSYINVDPKHWPEITLNWDVDPASQRYSLDGFKAREFLEAYPDGLLLGWVRLRDFDKVLCRFNCRQDDELWAVGDKSKLAFLIVYLSEGRPISPPFVQPINNSEVCFVGGNHRYAIAKVLKENEIPIYAASSDREAVSKLVSVRWAGAY